MTLVVLTEERSMKEFLNIVLPKFLPADVNIKIIPHDGKSDLRSSIPHKLHAWREPDTKFVVVQDQDSANCIELKRRLQDLCDQARSDVLVRIACVELEAWYFGDLKAVSSAYNKDLTYLSRQRKYRKPDFIQNPKSELRRILPEHQQILGAKLIAPYIDVHANTSVSFNKFIEGVTRLICG